MRDDLNKEFLKEIGYSEQEEITSTSFMGNHVYVSTAFPFVPPNKPEYEHPEFKIVFNLLKSFLV